MVILEFLAGIVGIALIALYAIGEFLALIIGLALWGYIIFWVFAILYLFFRGI